MSDDDQNQDDNQNNSQEDEDVVKVSKDDWDILNQRSKQVDEMAEELEKLKNKDYNFRELEKSSEKEKEKIKSKVAEKEKALEKEREDIKGVRAEMEKKHDDFVKDQLSSVHKKTLDDMCGDNQELRDRVEYEAKLIIGPMNNEDQIRQKYERAYLLAAGARPEPNPVNAVGSIPSNTYNRPKSKNYTETEAGKSNYDRWFNKPAGEVKPDSKVSRHLYNQ